MHLDVNEYPRSEKMFATIIMLDILVNKIGFGLSAETNQIVIHTT